MKRIGLMILALFFPWAFFLIEGMIGYAVLALVFQVTVIGWVVATYYALRMIFSVSKKEG